MERIPAGEIRSAKGTPEGPFAERGAADRESIDERHLMRTAKAQAGAITTVQLNTAGCSKRAIEHRVRSGRLRRRHRGVYAYGAVLGPLFHEWATFLACGSRAVLSHLTALALWGLAPRPAIVEVTLPTGSRGHEGVRAHRAALEAGEIVWRDGLPMTSVARTLSDVAASMPATDLARIVEEAQVRRLVTRAELEGLRRVPNLRAALAFDHEPSLTRSEAERRMLALIRAARLPAPVTNVRVGRYEVDMLWREQRLVVEIDGFEFHSSRPAFERDRVRDAELQAFGYRVLRVTWRRLVDEPEAVVALLAAALSAARSA